MRVRILSVLETFKMKYFKYCYSSPTRFEVFKFSLSGMDKAALSFDGTVAANIPIRQVWAFEIWEEARSFTKNNHWPELVH